MTVAIRLASAAATAPCEPAPDPLLSANIYAAGRLCEVIHLLVAPFWEEATRRDLAPGGQVWWLRYAKGGDHLKLRIHAPAAQAAPLRELLDRAQQAFWSQAARVAVQGRRSRPSAPPIDAEDQTAGDYPDRSFLWTTYRRSPVSLGDQPYCDDDGLVARLTRCLGAGAKLVLARLASGGDGTFPFAAQQTLHLKALLAALQGLPLTTEERAGYLLYHRDALLRFVRRESNTSDGARTMADALSRFRNEVHKRAAQAPQVAGWSRALSWDADLEDWRQAVRNLSDLAMTRCCDPSWDVDPFAPRRWFPALFRAFHGFANEIGLTPWNEAFSCHWLLAVSAGAALADRAVQLTPHFAPGAPCP